MRWTVALALLLLPAFARADSRLKITADRPIVIVVNLVPYTFGDGTIHTIDFKSGKEGRQNVRVLNLLGQEVWSGHVDVPENHEVKARYANRTFEVYEKRSLDTAGPTRLSGQDRSGADKLDAIAAGAGGPDSDEQRLDDVAALLEHADPVPVGTMTTADPTAPTPPPAGVASKLRLVNRTTSWANVYVGEQKIEFRGKPEPVELDLPSGAHAIRVKDFRDVEDWGHGTIWVYPDLTVELHFSKQAPPAAINRPEAWRPDAE